MRQIVNKGFIQIPILIFIVISLLTTSGVGYFVYNKNKLKQTIQPPVTILIPTAKPTSTANTEVLGKSIDNEIIYKTSMPTSVPVTTYPIISMIDTSKYSTREQEVLRNAYNEFLRTPNLKYMNEQVQNDLLLSIVKRYYEQYKLELEREINQAKAQLNAIGTATPRPVLVIQTPRPIYVNTEVETKLNELRQTLQNIQDQPVAMNVIIGRSQQAYQNWISSNPDVYSIILSSRYINDLNAILRTYGL